MRIVKEIIFRELTDADFFNINKPPGIEDTGGGQSYIDINTSVVRVRDWYSFLSGITPQNMTSGPRWDVLIHSLGVSRPPQRITIAQRRSANVAIRSQKIRSTRSQRVNAWRPNLTGFPDSPTPERRVSISDLHIYIVKLDNEEYWAGWFHVDRPEDDWYINDKLRLMFTRSEGYLVFDDPIVFNTENSVWPFEEYTGFPQSGNVFDSPGDVEDTYERVYFDEDEISDRERPVITTTQQIRVRNNKAVRKLKILYNNCCQISGNSYSFKKRNGVVYSEAHHLVPLGEGGSDSVNNIVILSPLIHRMLHYAKIEGIDLSNLINNELNIRINDEDYKITWHPDHGKTVIESI